MVDAVQEITQGLAAVPACISPKYFYDARGSEIFEEITRLPEYYPTRTERAIMQRYAGDIARKLGPGRTVIELGAGNCEKARSLCEAIGASRFVAVDISEEFLHQSVARLKGEMPTLDVSAFGADAHWTRRSFSVLQTVCDQAQCKRLHGGGGLPLGSAVGGYSGKCGDVS